MPDESVCPNLRKASVLASQEISQWPAIEKDIRGTMGLAVAIGQEIEKHVGPVITELTRDLAAARERIADLELSVSSDGLRMNLVDSLREKRQQLAAAREENERLMSEIVTQAGTILGFVESLRHMSFCRDCAEGSYEYCDGGKEALKRIDAALASQRQEKTS